MDEFFKESGLLKTSDHKRETSGNGKAGGFSPNLARNRKEYQSTGESNVGDGTQVST